MNNNILKKVVVTGPESTGKTLLTYALADEFNGTAIPEYAREYIMQLKRKYTYQDVEIIAKKQRDEYIKQLRSNKEFVFFDTFLIVTKVWFLWCYKKYPNWIDDFIKNTEIDLYLICNTDIQWQKDDVRENGGENRDVLFNMYLEEIKKSGVPYCIVNGTGDERLLNAVKSVQSFLK